MDADGGNKKLLCGNLPSSPGGIFWAEDGSGVYDTMAEKGESNLYFVALDGRTKKVTSGVHYLAGLSASKTGRAAAVVSTFYRPGAIATFTFACRPI
jgi:hypothetical protein